MREKGNRRGRRGKGGGRGRKEKIERGELRGKEEGHMEDGRGKSGKDMWKKGERVRRMGRREW